MARLDMGPYLSYFFSHAAHFVLRTEHSSSDVIPLSIVLERYCECSSYHLQFTCISS